MERPDAPKRPWLRALLAGAFWLAVWQAIAMAIGKPLILPSPLETGAALLHLMGTGAFYLAVGGTLLRIGLGFLAAVVLGVVLGALSAASPFAEGLLRPLRSLIKATPVISFILLVKLWMHSDIAPAFIAFLMVLPMIWANVLAGIRGADANLLEMARVFALRPARIVRLVYLPSLLPQLLTAAATGLGFAWKSGVAAEVMVRSAHSIGKNLVESQLYIETPALFAWTAAVVLLSILLERLLVAAVGRIAKEAAWQSA